MTYWMTLAHQQEIIQTKVVIILSLNTRQLLFGSFILLSTRHDMNAGFDLISLALG